MVRRPKAARCGDHGGLSLLLGVAADVFARVLQKQVNDSVMDPHLKTSTIGDSQGSSISGEVGCIDSDPKSSKDYNHKESRCTQSYIARFSLRI